MFTPAKIAGNGAIDALSKARFKQSESFKQLKNRENVDSTCLSYHEPW